MPTKRVRKPAERGVVVRISGVGWVKEIAFATWSRNTMHTNRFICSDFCDLLRRAGWVPTARPAKWLMTMTRVRGGRKP